MPCAGDRATASARDGRLEREALDDLVAARADTDGRDAGADELLDAQHVGLGVGGQVLEAAAAGDVLPPAVELLVDRRRVVEVGLVDRHLVVAHAADVVGDADRDLLEAGEDVELGDDEVGDAVDARGVAADDGVHPAAAARTARRRAVLGARLAEELARVVVQLGRERALADAGRVGLEDRDDRVDAGRGDAGPRARTRGDGVARRDVGVGAVVDVEQGGLPGLEEHSVAPVERLAQHEARVGDHGSEAGGIRQQLLDDLVDLGPAGVVDLGQQLVLQRQGRLDLLAQDALVVEVLDADADTVHLVGVGRADAATGRADAALAEEALGHLVDGAVVARDDVRVGADEQLARVDAAGLQAVELLEEHAEVDDDAVADDRHAVRAEDAGGQQVQRVLLALAVLLDHDGVAGVVAAVVLDDVVDAAAEQVGRLALALIAPLRSDEHDCRHRSAFRLWSKPTARLSVRDPCPGRGFSARAELWRQIRPPDPRFLSPGGVVVATTPRYAA